MESSRVQSISPGLPAPSHPVLGHSFLAVFLAVHRVEETVIQSLPIPSKLATWLAVFSAVDETVAGGEVAGDQCAVYKVHSWVVVHLQWKRR